MTKIDLITEEQQRILWENYKMRCCSSVIKSILVIVLIPYGFVGCSHTPRSPRDIF